MDPNLPNNQSNNPLPTSAPPPKDQDQDFDALVKQYQQLLSDYSDEVNSSPSPSLPPPENQLSSQPSTPPPAVLPPPAPDPVPPKEDVQKPLGLLPPPLPQPDDKSLPPVGPAVPDAGFTSTSLPPPEDPTTPLPPTFDQSKDSPKSSTNIFQYLFFLSLFIFIGVCVSIVYVLFTYQKPATPPSSTVPPAATSQPEPAPLTCALNDKQYQIGESFTAADGCNTCTCQPDQTIVCTEEDCAPPIPSE